MAILFVDSQQPASLSMSDLAAQAVERGWAIRLVDIRRESHVAQRWRVHNTPTTVLVRSGREVDRILGPSTWTEFSRRMLRFSAPDSIRGATASPQISQQASSSIDLDRLVPMQQRPSKQSASENPVTATDPQAATVRIIVDEPESHAVGSGTIIDSSQNGAVVLTCGHLFRNWSKSSVVYVERFESGVPVRYQASLVDYQIDDIDIGVLVINPGKVVPSARVAQQADLLREGDPVFSLGCDHGDLPSRRDSRVTKLNRYMGSANIETAGAPVQGRSGGGLFNSNGELLGVCFAADAQLDEGLYCGTRSVLDRLQKLGITDSAKLPSVAAEPSKPTLQTTMTVIMTDSSGDTRQLTIDQPTEQLVNAMRQESQRTRQANATSQVRWKVQGSAEPR
ncbi:MAG: trypsin-like peptidase domain-containing protein [Planctomycetaceae bacterium]|nr:trypsin-like peptidase domain-containing protein [Planctomycetaceae bacterium]MCE2814399.1 trypsin-like peptidase domain-containing protein [Planctomycetaceae bacterium]